MKILYPKLSDCIEKLPMKAGKILCNVMIVFMVFNCLISALALARYTERNKAREVFSQTEQEGEILSDIETASDADDVKVQQDDRVQENEAVENTESRLDRFLDEHFDDERMERIYPNAKIVEE